jgi:dipeptidyl aminopeptidase/acylaminoacyl peptidase
MFRVLVAAAVVAVLGLAGPVVAAPPPAEAYAAPAQVREAALSPSGRWIAVVSQYNDHDLLRIYDAQDLATFKAQALMPDLVGIGWMRWKSDDRLVFGEVMPAFFGTGAGGQIVERTDLFSVDRELKGFVNLSPRPKNFTETPNLRDDVVSFLPEDPDHILVAIDWRTSATPAVRKVDVRTGFSGVAHDRDGRVVSWLADREGTVRVAYGDPTGHGPSLFKAAADGALAPLEPKGRGQVFSLVGFDGSPSRLVVLSDHEGGTAGLYVYDLDKDAFTEKLFKDDRYDVAGAVFGFDGRKVVGAAYDADEYRIHFTDAGYAKAREGIEAIVGRHDLVLLGATADGARALVAARQGDRLTETWWVDVPGHVARPLLRVAPAPDAAGSAKVVSVAFKARDGLEIPGYITLPLGMERLDQLKGAPFIVMPHGGPHARADADYDFETQFLASRGYAVFEPNFRGSAGYGEAFRAAGVRQWGEAIEDDIADGTAWLVAKGYADPKRMCAAGWSFGGYAALMAAVRQPGVFRCVVSVAGPTDLDLLIQNETVFYGGALAAREFIGRAWKDRARLHENSPVRHAADIGVPVLLVHGRADWTVPVDHSRLMAEALKARNKDVQFLEFPLSEHSLGRASDRLAYLKALDAFLAKNLGPAA